MRLSLHNHCCNPTQVYLSLRCYRITEATLTLRTEELTHAQSTSQKNHLESERAFALASQIRAREEESKQREREMEWKVGKAEEERKLADLVLGEYADLVRNLEGRAPKHSSEGEKKDGTTPLDTYRTGLQGLSTILSESNASTEVLHARIASLEKELAETEAKFDAEKKTAELDRKLLAKVQDEVVKMRVDDMGAARMVAKYMQVPSLPSP